MSRLLEGSLQLLTLGRRTGKLTPAKLGVSAGALIILVGNMAIASPSSPNLKQTDDTGTNAESLNDVRFSCELEEGQYTVMYFPESQPDQGYPWAVPTEMGGGWTPEARCNEISRRLESYRPDGLREMRIGEENGYDIICVTTEADPGCRIVLTVPVGQDPIATRDRVFENLVVADSGQQTDAVVTFTEDDDDFLGRIGEALGIDLPSNQQRRSSPNSIDLRPFLDEADGGTGSQLR